MTNTHLSKEIFKLAGGNGSFAGMNETELRDYQMWNMQELQDYLLEIVEKLIINLLFREKLMILNG